MKQDVLDLTKQAEKRIKEGLKQVLKDAGLTYDDLGAEVNMTKSDISKYLNDQRGSLPPLWIAILDKCGYELQLVKKEAS